ncbi:MAG: hypothetical protein HYV09_12230 [Deltaproteobacteria bacterium]|nr:hypothetical protein [Deltaproteobacteria bacterium]
MSRSARVFLLASPLVLGLACGGRLGVGDERGVPPDAATLDDAAFDAAAIETGPVDAAVADVADVADAPPPICACCGGPFASRINEWTSAVVSTAAGDVVTGGNVPKPGGIGPLWLARVGHGGVSTWKRVYDGEVGALMSLVEANTGGFVLLRSEGSGNMGVRVVATNVEGESLWSKTLGAGKKDAVANGAVATPKGVVVAGGSYEPSPLSRGAWSVWLDHDGNVLRELVDTSLAGWGAPASSRSGFVAMCGWNASGDTCVVEAPDGTVAWRRALPLEWSPMKIAVAEDGSLYAAGVRPALEFPWSPDGTRPGRVVVARFDAKGELLWQKEHGWPKPAEVSVQSLIATPDGGFALNGYLADPNLKPPKTAPADAIVWYWHVLRGTAAGAITWSKGYAPAGPPGGQGRGVAACKDGLVLVGATLTSTPASWMVRTNAAGGVTFAPPGSTIDL